MTRTFLLASAALLTAPAYAQPAPSAQPAAEQPVPPAPPAPQRPVAAPPVVQAPASDEDGEDVDQEITVTGARPRGSVIGNIPPENVLNTRDIRATGATSISELLSSVASQTGSARGRTSGPPVVLLNGQRISGFRELRDLPPEAIARMEILPEEVALKYGYSADQRVINFVLRRRFNSTAVEVGGRIATEGGYSAGRADIGKLIISEDTRTSGNLRVEGNNPLYETERDIAQRIGEPLDSRPFRTLVGAGQSARLSGTISRPINSNGSGSLTGELERRRGTSGLGLLSGNLLDRRTSIDTLGLGTAFNSQAGRWRLSATGNVEVVGSESDTELTGDLSRSTRQSLVVDGTANGPLVTLPAGTGNVTLRVGASALNIDSRSRRSGLDTRTDLKRQVVEGSANVDVPLTERSSAVGRLTANLNGGLRGLSDFGTLSSIGAGLNWSPRPRMNLLASWTREEGAPSLQQLGDPFLDTTGVPFFDAVRGETVTVRTLTGGNPDLDADRRNVFKVGGNWQPIADPDLRLRAEYVRQGINNPQINFPAASVALQNAFPDRFQRDPGGRLLSVDLRPVNAESSRRETFRWGFDFTKSLRTQRPSQGTISRLVARARQSGTIITQPPSSGGTAPAPGTAPQRPVPQSGDNVVVVREGNPPAAAGPGAGGGGGGRGFRFGGPGGGGGPFGGGGRGGRITFSATHTLTLTDELVIGPGLPVLDFLDGEALGSTGGRARHQIEFESGYYNNGFGVRLSGNWRSATRVVTGGDDLRFSPYSTFDLRVFANLGERLDLVTRSPFFRGTSVRLEVNNIFNSRPEVRGGSGSSAIPFAYQADRLEPIGRTIGVTFRKLFVPRRFIQQTVRQFQQGRRPE